MTRSPSSPPPSTPRVLVVDDERFIRDVVAEFLVLEGYQVLTACDGQEAIAEIEQRPFDAIVTDLKMPRVGGLELLAHVNHHHPGTVVVVMTGFGTVETAIGAMKRGAADYVLKPFKVEEVLHIVRRGLEKRRLEAENLRLRDTLSLFKVSEAIAASLSMDEVLDTLVSSALRDVHADSVAVWLRGDSGDITERVRECRDGAKDDALESPELGLGQVENPVVDMGHLNGAAVLQRLKEGPFLGHGQEARSWFSAPCAPPAHSVAAVSLRVRNETVGWLAVVSQKPGTRFDEGQRKLLSMVANRAAAAIENARLYEHLQTTFQQTVSSLARTIDTLDHYTAGHSERVARYAVRLARWLGLPETDMERVRQAALMHDIGKIGCVMNLNKPGRLTDDEYETFKMHPGYGKDILEPVSFLGPVIPGVHLHHERWDGTGYPLGLEGKSIPMIARIISVADTYDAMTSDRAYRSALPHEISIEEIFRCRRSQFDPDIAGVFTEQIDALRDESRDTGTAVPK